MPTFLVAPPREAASIAHQPVSVPAIQMSRLEPVYTAHTRGTTSSSPAAYMFATGPVTTTYYGGAELAQMALPPRVDVDPVPVPRKEG